MASTDPCQSPDAGVAVEFERLAQRPLGEAERLVIERLSHGRSLWVEGLAPEATVGLALALAQARSLRILYVAPDSELLVQRHHRYGARATTHLLPGQLPSRLPSGAGVFFTHTSHLASGALAQALVHQPVDLVFVEQAHAVTSSSAEYRPSLQKLRTLTEKLGLPLLASAARSSQPVAQEARQLLGLERAETIVESWGSLSLQLLTETEQRSLAELIAPLPRPTLVLCATPARADAVFAELSREQLPCHRYHGAMPATARAVELLQFALPGRRAILVATSSFAPHHGLAGENDSGLQEDFGRGYGRADLRSLVHVGLPSSLDQFAQELGLLQRNGEPAEPGYAVAIHELEQAQAWLELAERKRPCPDTLTAVVQQLKSGARGAWLSERQLLSAVGGSERAGRLCLAFLHDGGAIERSNEGGSSHVRALSLAGLEQVAAALGTSFEELREGDVLRHQRLLEFAEASGCRRIAFERAFGRDGGSACGLCDDCNPEQRVEGEGLRSRVHERRAPARFATPFEDGEAEFDDDDQALLG